MVVASRIALFDFTLDSVMNTGALSFRQLCHLQERYSQADFILRFPLWFPVETFQWKLLRCGNLSDNSSRNASGGGTQSTYRFRIWRCIVRPWCVLFAIASSEGALLGTHLGFFAYLRTIFAYRSISHRWD